jgi:hypothetical protein
MFSRKWLYDAAERMGTTFVQFYLGFWLLKVGLFDTSVSDGSADAFDLLFTSDNAKAGVVGLALSLAKAVGASQIGSRNTASLLPEGPDTDQG